MRRWFAAALSSFALAAPVSCASPPPAETPSSPGPSAVPAPPTPKDEGPGAPAAPEAALQGVTEPRPGPDAQPSPDDEVTAFVLDVLAHGPRVPPVPRSGPLWDAATRAAETSRQAEKVRKLVESPAFAARYKAFRDEQGRGDEPPRARTSKELRDESLSGRERAIAEVKRMMTQPGLDAASKAAMKEALAAAERELAETRAHPERFDEMARVEAEEARQRKSDHDAKRAAARARLPEDPRSLVLARLEELLRETSDVAFDAKLVDSSGRRRFADPKHEARSAVWKAAFRAGRPAMTAARSFASAWVADLKRAGVTAAKPAL